MADTYILPNKQLAAALLSPLRMALTIVIVPCVILLAFWVLCLGLYYTLWHRSVEPLAALYQAAHGALGEGGLFSHLEALAGWVTSQLHTLLFDHDLLPDVGVAPAATPEEVGKVLTVLVREAATPLRVVELATQVFGLRLALLAGIMPMVLLAFSLAHTDAGAERLIRRACAGRESANLYHQAKSMQFALTGLVLMTTLWSPVHVNPLYTMVGAAAGIVPLAWLQGTFYKKYR